MSAPDRDPWRQRGGRADQAGGANIWAMDDVPATYRGATFGAQTSSTDATRARASDLPSDASTVSATYGDPIPAYGNHGPIYERQRHQGASFRDPGPVWDAHAGGSRGTLQNDNSNNNNDSGAGARDDDSDSDLLLPSTPSSSSTAFFGSDAIPPRLVDASALPPPGTFDDDDFYHQDTFGYAYADAQAGAAPIPTNGLEPVSARWLHDPVVAAAEFAGAGDTRRAPTTAAVPRVAVVASGRSRKSHTRSTEPPRRVPLAGTAMDALAAPKTRPAAPVANAPYNARMDIDQTARDDTKQNYRHEHIRDDGVGTTDGGVTKGIPINIGDRDRAARVNNGGSRGRHKRGDRRDTRSDAKGQTSTAAAALLPLFNSDGFVVPLARRRRTWQLPVCIAGQAVWVAVSTTRRTLTVSTHDLREARLRVPVADLVCSMPSKRAQLYCSDVVIPVEDPAGGGATAAIRARRFDFYVGRGRFASRVGLLGGPDRRSLFAHLRLPVDLFALRLDHPRSSAWSRAGGDRSSSGDERQGGDAESARARKRDHRRRRCEDSWLALGAAAEPPEGAVSCALVPAPGDEKGIVAVAAAGLCVGRVRFDFLDPLPAIVHAEVPGLCVPRELHDAVVEQIADASGLFCGGTSVERGRRALARAVARLPHLSIVLYRDPQRPGGGRVRLDVPPWAYTLWHRPRPLNNDQHADDRSAGGGDDGGRLQLLISPLEAPEHDDHQCMVMGAACLSRCVAAFSVDRGRAWFWSDADDSDLPSTSDDEGDGCRP